MKIMRGKPSSPVEFIAFFAKAGPVGAFSLVWGKQARQARYQKAVYGMATLSPPLPKKWLPRKPAEETTHKPVERGGERGGPRDKGLFRPWFPVKKEKQDHICGKKLRGYYKIKHVHLRNSNMENSSTK